MGHIGYQNVQWLIHTGLLNEQENKKAVSNSERPKCDEFEFGKVHFLTNKIKTTKKSSTKEQKINKYQLLTGHMVSEYHHIFLYPGIIYHTMSK